ncbi:MAG: hydroxymethylbilane synthase [Woeseia sp.]|nr:hydroxymethylbilane synthase [Woeseia sp.]|tara:strand:+ start:3125 stop:4039 length:915 start_codon:yes stop_codon:yes gene_type:complete
MEIRIATRKSKLALWQSNYVAKRLLATGQITSTSLVPISTRGDKILDKSLNKIGGKGLFIKELEVALKEGTADIAVHSMKDLPANMPLEFCIGSTLERANPADALISRNNVNFDLLPPGALVGTSSLRRQAQIKAMRPDIRIEPLRGNVETRLKKLANRQYDAIILARAGLERLGLKKHITETFTFDQMLPAACQGVVGIECLNNRRQLKAILESVQDPIAKSTTAAERSIVKVLNADCQSPVASYAAVEFDKITVTGLVASRNGEKVIRETTCGNAIAAKAIGADVANKLLTKGAGELLKDAE